MSAATIVIPAYNEEKNIKTVIERVRAVSSSYEIIVVDDGSTDRTGELAGREKAKVIRLGQNKGKGFACMEGAGAAKTEKIVFIDADLQLKPEEIPLFVNALDKCDLAIGIRNMKNVPFQRRLSNIFAAKLLGGRDVLCGFRAARKGKLLELGLKMRRYEFEVEMLINAKRRKFKISDIPVSVSYESYNGMGIGDGLKVLLFIFKERLKKGEEK